MRLIKVRIRAGDIASGENQLMYPTRYNPIEVDRFGGGVGRLNKVDVSMSGEIGRGGSEEFMFIVMPDALAQEYADDPDMMIVDSTTADASMEQSRINNGVPEEQIDSDIIAAITAKQNAGLTLTQANLDALDPTKAEKGITKARKPVLEMVPDIDDVLTALPKKKKEFQTVNK